MPERFAFPEEVIDAWAEDRGRLAVCGVDARATFWDLRDASRRLAGVLAEAGVAEGARVVVALPVGVAWAVAELAILRLRAVAVTVAAAGDRSRLEATTAAAVISDLRGAAWLGGLSFPIRACVDGAVDGWIDARRPPERPFVERARARAAAPVRIDTRGPVGLALGGGWLHAQRTIAEFWLDLRRTDLFWPIVPVEDPLAFALVAGAWAVGAPVVLGSEGSPGDAFEFLPVSVLHAPAGAYARLAASGQPMPELRHCTTAEPLGAEAAESWRAATGLAVHAGFGVAACPLLLAHLRGLPVRPGSVGRPLPGHDVHLVDAAGSDASDGEPGEIVLRGRPPTRAFDVGTDEAEEVLRTGVRARRDPQGYVWLAEPVA